MTYSVAIFISGTGSYAAYAAASPRLRDVDIAVIADRPMPNRPGPVHRLLVKKDTPDYWDRFKDIAQTVDLVMLNFNWVVPAEICAALDGRMINQHLALLPAFKGLHVQQAVLAAGVRVSGATFHFVTPHLDAGPIIAQTLIPVSPQDTPASLGGKTWEATKDAYVQVLRWFADGRVHRRDGRVEVAGASYALSACIPNVEA